MTVRNHCLIAVTAPLDEAGVSYTITRNKHIIVRWAVAGQKRMIVVARTGSDHRSEMNNRTLVRRILRQDGMLPA